MKRIMGLTGALLVVITSVWAQKADDERMKRDIEVAENVLSTLIKQEIGQQRSFFPVEVSGTYMPGYGVTFRVPGDAMVGWIVTSPQAPVINGQSMRWSDGVTVYSSGDEESMEDDQEEWMKDDQSDEDEDDAYVLKNKRKKKINRDSARADYNNKIIKASKDFILDYGDFLTQLAPNERIIVTNQSGEGRFIYFSPEQKRSRITIEATKADVLAFRQGKLNREQALSKLKVVNTETVTTKEADLELLTSIFARLYRPDLSKTFFSEDNIYYERLKDYGVVFYMQVFSSNQIGYQRYSMPTIGLQSVDQQTRDKKVAEIYPKFEQELMDNMLEYGRTLKNLKDDELLIFNTTLTRCKGCNIPASVEVSVKGSVLKDYNTGKLNKSSAMSKITLKKGPNQ